jgi:hypothetical protein
MNNLLTCEHLSHSREQKRRILNNLLPSPLSEIVLKYDPLQVRKLLNPDYDGINEFLFHLTTDHPNCPDLCQTMEILLVGQDVVFEWEVKMKGEWEIWSPCMTLHCVYGDLGYYLKEVPELIILRRRTLIWARLQQTRSTDLKCKLSNQIAVESTNGSSHVDVVNLILSLCKKLDLSFIPCRIDLETQMCTHSLLGAEQFPPTYLRNAEFYSDLLSV